LELISHDTKAELVRCFLDIAVTLARAKQHCAPYLAALGLLLNRTPLHAGPEIVVSPDLVERAYAAFQDFDWTDPELLDLQNLFLRAARVVDDRRLDVPKPLRTPEAPDVTNFELQFSETRQGRADEAELT
jgi:hypothetical protein